MKEKKTLSHENVCSHMLDFKQKMGSRIQIRGKISSFSKTASPQREPFLTMFYTINLSTLLRYQVRFYANHYFENYQQCPLPLEYGNTFRGKVSVCRHHFFIRYEIIQYLIYLNEISLFVKMSEKGGGAIRKVIPFGGTIGPMLGME